MSVARRKLKIACPSCLQKLDVTELEPFTRLDCPRCGGEVIAPRPFGPFLLEEPLGARLGIASYRALDLTLDREVLVRILEDDAPGLAEGFLALARKAAAVNHPGVLPIFSCGIEEGKPYLVNQFMPGGTLAPRLSRWSAASDESVRLGVEWVRRATEGLQAAAAQGIVHGAVSPQSILLDGDDHAKLADFGLDVLTLGTRSPAAAYGADVAAYLSPEVLAGSPASTAADVFGLGAVLYHLLSGRSPCGEVADGEAARQFWRTASNLPPPRALNPQVPEELSLLCLRLLATDPGARPGNLGDLAQSLTSARKTAAVSPQQAAERRVRTLAAAARSRPRPGPRSVVVGRRDRPRSRWVDALIVAGLLVLAALGGGLYVRQFGWPRWLVPPAGGGANGGLADAVPSGRAAADSAAAAGGSGALPPGPPADELPLEGVSVVDPGADARPGADAAAEQVSTGGVAGGPAAPAERARRPRPDDLDFLGAKAALAGYLKGLPAADLALERERIDLIGDTRSYLVRLMKYVSFREGQEVTIQLRGGSVLRGAVAYCNETQVSVRREGDNSLRALRWDELAFEQIVSFLEYYVQLRASQGQVAGGAPNRALRQEVGEDLLRLAVLCDWYGRAELAERFARRAADADPASAGRVARLLPAHAR